MSFQQGLSGLNTSTKQLDTIGNNVANAGTVGFKQSTALFSDMYAASLAGAGAVQVGTGGKLSAVSQQFTQGNITNTSNPLDTAISGQGFFRMIDTNGAIFYSRNGQFSVDKSGFIVNAQGHQVSGYQAVNGVVGATQGALQMSTVPVNPKQTSAISVGANLDSRAAYPTGLSQGAVVGTVAPALPLTVVAGTADTFNVSVDGVATVPSVTIAPGTYTTAAALATAVQTAVNGNAALVAAGKSVAVTVSASTGILSMTANSAGPTSSVTAATDGAGVPGTGTVTRLFGGASPLAGSTGTGTFNPNLASTYNNSTSLTVYDVKGTPHITSLYFQKIAPNIQRVYLTIDGTQVPAAAGTPIATLNFSAAGQLLTAAPVQVPPPPAAAGPTSSTQSPNNLKTVISDPTYTPLGANPMPLPFDFTNVTQFGGNFGVSALTQDGYSFGQLNGFSTSPDGTILGRYSNGQSQAMGQIALANFTNPQGLQSMGNNEWVETSASGSPLVGKPGTSSLGVLQSSATEDSNVDLTAELVNMITAQRIYQANAQSIKAQDQVLQTLVNLR